MNIRKMLIVVLLLNIWTILDGNAQSFEGNIQFVEISKKEADQDQNQSVSLLYQIKDQKVRMSNPELQKMMGIDFATVVDYEAEEAFVLQGDGEYGTIVYLERDYFLKKKETKPSITYLNKTKKICGYKCKKALVEIKGNTNVFWYTKALFRVFGKNEYGIDGFPMEYTINSKGKEKTFRATLVKKSSLPESLFQAPINYTEMDVDDFKPSSLED